MISIRTSNASCGVGSLRHPRFVGNVLLLVACGAIPFAMSATRLMDRVFAGLVLGAACWVVLILPHLVLQTFVQRAVRRLSPQCGHVCQFLLMNAFVAMWLAAALVVLPFEQSPAAQFKRYVSKHVPASIRGLRAGGRSSLGGTTWVFTFTVSSADIVWLAADTGCIRSDEASSPVTWSGAFVHLLGERPVSDAVWRSYKRSSSGEEGVLQIYYHAATQKAYCLFGRQ